MTTLPIVFVLVGIRVLGVGEEPEKWYADSMFRTKAECLSSMKERLERWKSWAPKGPYGLSLLSDLRCARLSVGPRKVRDDARSNLRQRPGVRHDPSRTYPARLGTEPAPFFARL
jgi:hypothetical protein